MADPPVKKQDSKLMKMKSMREGFVDSSRIILKQGVESSYNLENAGNQSADDFEVLELFDKEKKKKHRLKVKEIKLDESDMTVDNGF